MIGSFGDAATADLFHGRDTARVRKLSSDLRRAAIRKLDLLNAASRLDDLASPPGNRLERLSGDRKGFCSIRVNDKWRIVFQWQGETASEVSLTDYH